MGRVAAGRRTRDVPRVAPKRPWRWVGMTIIVSVWGALAVGAILLFFTWDMPGPEAALAATRRPSVTLQAGDGRVIATSGDIYGDVLRLSDMPASLPAALIAIEDRRFRSHWGLDVVGLARAAWVNLTAGRVAQGGSTITQQLAKNLFLTPARSFRRKVQEALLALWLERRFTKDEILEIYLNRVYLGAGAYGVDAAARLYFGISARRLELWQSAILAGLPRAPSRLNPRANPAGAVARGMEVLDAMAETGAIRDGSAAALAERMAFPRAPSREAGWFADWAQDDLAERFPGNADLVLRSALDAGLQSVVEARLEALLAGAGAQAGVAQGAVVAMEAETGAVRAMAGGRDYRASPFNRAVQARRQPGSAMKAFVFLAALEAGATPDDMVSDAPVSLGGWSPGNGAWRARGEISLEEAFAQSVNGAAVRVMQRAGGPRPVAAVATRLGLAGPHPRDGSIALGTGEASLLELTAAYAAFANGGMRVVPHALREARAGGQRVPVPAATPVRVIEAGHAAEMRRMLEAVVARGTGRGAGRGAGKTGTTQDFRDAWYIGFDRGLVLGIWLGNDDGTPMRGVAGGGLPVRLWREIMEGVR
ncbi:PBP1A family penicillin-binding protein [Roseomonas arctica]|uniref:PBP1A family penicillin-binding protein n=2 Tax=Plastoroseomonas arctica TaxID=1509237 RepID=A0AAF1JWH0_9PROT|nr:PBP1A family penicillin-binding protein [Plastoroseomonas arctica]